MIKVSHEIPKMFFEAHDLINDYPYGLAHLLIEGGGHYDSTYADFYKVKMEEADFSILDNSCYELGYPIDSDILHALGEEYNPSHLVIPDVYQDMGGTMSSVRKYLEKYGAASTPKFFAVVQGTTLKEYVECFDYFCTENRIDIVGINFKTLSDGNGRKDFLEYLRRNSRLENKKLHLLGCQNASEFLEYDRNVMDYIHSVDTSAPIVHGWNMNKFTKEPFSFEKPAELIADNLDRDISEEELKCITHNVKMFRSYIH